ncbi:E3 ubiquitin-protein ligase RNF213-like isoform X2 [Xenia sp. Carnegie-2017]|nr:E3 ubiquitin-protein ligase RNF213-like isoform X2 [Xenia sp. Carnegie-2017]
MGGKGKKKKKSKRKEENGQIVDLQEKVTIESRGNRSLHEQEGGAEDWDMELRSEAEAQMNDESLQSASQVVSGDTSTSMTVESNVDETIDNSGISSPVNSKSDPPNDTFESNTTEHDEKKDDGISNAVKDNSSVFKNVLPVLRKILHSAIHEKVGTIVYDMCNHKDLVPSDPAVIEECIRWVIQTIPSVEKQQLLFLCALLGYLVNIKGVNILKVPNNNTTKSAFDKLLYNLENCFKKQFRLPENFLQLLANCACTIVEGCSKPGWLTLAAYFRCFLGMDYVLQFKMDDYQYSKQEYYKLLPLAVCHLPKVNFRQQVVYHRYLKRILQFAPDDEVLFQMSQDKQHVFRFFLNPHEREQFFLNFLWEKLNSGKGSLSEKLAALNQLPQKMRKNLHSIIYGYVQYFIDEATDPSSEDMNAVFNLISNFNVESFRTILQSVSKSQSYHRANIFPQLLNDPRFESCFRQLSVDERAYFCRYWVRNQADSSKESAEKVKATFEAFDILVSCRHISSDGKVVERLCKVIDNELRQNDLIAILEGSKNFDHFSEYAQKCIKKLIQDTIKPYYLRNYSETLKYFTSATTKMCDSSSSSIVERFFGWFGQSRPRISNCKLCLLKCALNVLTPPKDGDNNENVIVQILQFCNIWVELVAAKEHFYQENAFKAWEKIWKVMGNRIMREDITISTLKKIEPYRDQLSLIFCGLNSGNEKEQNSYASAITKLVQTEADFRQKCDLLVKAEKFSHDVFPSCSLKESIKNYDEESRKLNEINESFWKPYAPLLQQLKPLEELLNSESFSRIAKTYLQENLHDFYSCLDTIDRNFQVSFFQNLSKQGVHRFELEWQKLFDKPDDLTVGQLNALLGDMNLNKLDDELALLENHFQRKLPSNIKSYLTDFMEFPHILEQTRHIKDFLQSFGICDTSKSADILMVIDFCGKFDCDVKDVLIEKLHESIKTIQEIISRYDIDHTDVVMIELVKSTELIQFIQEIADEDIRVLIDAVEEHSDEAVSASLVSDLIQVHGFLVPVIKKLSYPPDLVLKTLVGECKRQANIAQKIRQCSMHVHSLRGLYQNVANREEMTREIIRNCLIDGEFDIILDGDGICHITMRYQKESKQTIKSMPELHDLRSRAHLILSSEQNPREINSSESKEAIDFHAFIERINLLSDIEEAIIRLQSSGYVKYQKDCEWKSLSEVKRLEVLKTTLSEDLHEWEECLNNARERHYFLNYFWSHQLSVLYDFFTGKINDLHTILTLMKFVDQTMDLKRLRDFANLNCHYEAAQTPYEIIAAIGGALDDLFSHICPPLSLREISNHVSQLERKVSVQKGELYVVALEEESPHTVNVLMSLYEDTTNAFPEPHQVMFCNETTLFEQLQIFLNRCFNNNKNLDCDSLFCLANVELLSNELQFYLIDYIKKKEFQDCDQNYLLAILCRGGARHHIIEEFSKFSHHISGMSYPEIASRFKSKWPHVKCVTSTLQGLGKTEYIRNDALEMSMNVVSFPISGEVIESKIIERLKKLHLKDFQCLHFDVGEVDDPILLDTFIFQLIITGMVSYGTQMYSLHNHKVYIELANSLDNWLVERLQIAGCFCRVELTWNDFNDLEITSKITSNIQVVCQYLNILDKGKVDTTDIHFAGREKVKPLSEQRCRELLRQYYGSSHDPTFAALNTFLGFLGNQLRKLSKSAFFEVENLKLMLEENASGVRKNLLRTLLEVSQDFACRSLTTHHSTRMQQNLSSTVQSMVHRVEGMIQWEQSNHLLIVFQSIDSQTVAAFYREKSKVPSNICELLKSQTVGEKSKELVDYKELSHVELHKMLEKIACTRSSQGNVAADFSGYALTADNMLKMILIILRIRAKIPIIIMGETGCGKTSLVQYLASTCGIPFSIYNFHAGRTDDEIRKFVEKESDKAQSATSQRWIFLDEINTCHHLGLINEIMCHHALLGRPISRKLVFIAACNPYKLRSLESSSTAGLEGKKVDDEYSKLVYRVHPLPESMVDYVWDYGSLTPQDEKVYIGRMVNEFPEEYQHVLTELLALSQNFIRDVEKNPFCVSLRDVRRCIHLVKWFIDTLKKRKMLMKKILENGEEIPKVPSRLKEAQKISERYDDLPEIKSFVLALGHCYLSRLQTDPFRREYIKRLTPSLASIDVDKKSFIDIIRMEQEDYLSRMELPEGTARNAALRENVFVMLVSILNRIPVFVVGKPGCSKSLAIQLIRSNLRGKDSKDAFFKTLPHLYVVSYQGSESSTSEGIEEIFKKASNYKKHNSSNNVLPVVLLDEVGLAENSPNNPLKVLHSILEPGKGELPEVAVVGISNWALDAAKMNRAIHLSRPEPSIKDLSETAISLYQGDQKSKDVINTSTENVLRLIAEAYHVYRSKQLHSNFHGLRDYYSLVKSLKCGSCSDMESINIALKRNFGGIPEESSVVQEIFNERLKTVISASKTESYIPVTRLIEENINDLKARHLMLISNGDSAIGILRQHVFQSTKETITIFGSNFEEDISDDYNYRILSRIILCMERNCILILRDLECIYGSLYDMLNQNYSVVGGRKNCRVALGANSNPMCYVNDGFRCIVLVDHDQVDYSDPPFLNRFEKQLLRFSDMLNETQQEIRKELESWVYQMSSVGGFRDKFKEEDMFIGFNEDTLPSLVLYHSHDSEEPEEVVIKKCKDDLMWIATPDGVLRTVESDRYNEDPREVEKLSNEYFEKPIHNGLASFLSHFVKRQHLFHDVESETCSIIFLMTHATVHTDISHCLHMENISFQIERLGAYKSGKQLEDKIHNFFTSEKELLVVQCKPELDAEHMLFTRSIIEENEMPTSSHLGSSAHFAKETRLHDCPRASSIS